MMQMDEIRQRFGHIEQMIHHASEVCRHAILLPMDLKDCIQLLDERSEQARQTMQTQDEESVLRCIDDLEELGDKAKSACERTGTVDDEVRNAIMQAHRELSELKHQLH